MVNWVVVQIDVRARRAARRPLKNAAFALCQVGYLKNAKAASARQYRYSISLFAYLFSETFRSGKSCQEHSRSIN